MDFERIAHLEWSKLMGGRFRYDLGGSGVPGATAREFPFLAAAALPEYGHAYGFSDNAELIGRRYGLDRRHVLLGAGTSMVNFLVMAALLRPGDEVLVERPTYEPLREIPRALGARVVRFTRSMAGGFAPDLDEIHRLLTPATRLLVLTNLHNPSGTAVTRETLGALGDLARERGLHVMVDEVYLEFALAPGELPARLTAASLGPEMIVTSSLTKAYGLSELRAGWAIAPPGVVERAYRVHDYLGVNDPGPSSSLAAVALRHLETLAERARRISETGRAVFAQWIAGRNDLAWVVPAGGIVAFVRITSRVSSRDLAAHLAARHDTLVVPGEFFESPGHLRIGLGLPPDLLREALARVGRGLDEMLA